MENKVTEKQVDDKIVDLEWETQSFFGRSVTVVAALLANGFIIIETSTCASEDNYDLEIGKEICMERVRQKIWELEGYLLKEKMAGGLDDGED